MEKSLAICIAGTKNYLYAWEQCVKRVITAALYFKTVHFIFCTDESEEGENAAEFLSQQIPSHWKTHIIKQNMDDNSQNYKKEAQMRIAKLQGAGFQLARTLNVDFCWSVESDVLVDPQALEVAEWALNMPGNFYDIAAVLYFNGAFLCGGGSYSNAIAEDFLPHERRLPKRLLLIHETNQKRLKEFQEKFSKKPKTEEDIKILTKGLDKERKREARLRDKIKKYPPDGNIWEVTAKHGWRQRGWFDNAFPALRCPGAIVESWWCGLGCTLLNKRALQYANFDGYSGQGTQDLHLVNEKWHPKGLRIAAVPHVLCDHIKPKTDEKGNKLPGEYTHWVAYHEKDGPYEGHLRIRSKPWEPV